MVPEFVGVLVGVSYELVGCGLFFRGQPECSFAFVDVDLFSVLEGLYGALYVDLGALLDAVVEPVYGLDVSVSSVVEHGDLGACIEH